MRILYAGLDRQLLDIASNVNKSHCIFCVSVTIFDMLGRIISEISVRPH